MDTPKSDDLRRRRAGSTPDAPSLADLEGEDHVSGLKRREAVRLEDRGCIGLVPIRKHFSGNHPAAYDLVVEPFGSEISECHPKGVFVVRAVRSRERGQSRARDDGQAPHSIAFLLDEQVESVRVVLGSELVPLPGSNHNGCHSS